MILLVAAALAGPVILAIREDDGAFSGAVPRVTLTDAAGHAARVDMQDGATPPDKTASDAVWTAATTALGAGPYTILVTDGGDIKVWRGTFPGVPGDPTVLRLSMQSGGGVSELGVSDLAVGAAPAAVSPTPSPSPAAPGEPRADGGAAEAGAPGGSGPPPGEEGEAGPPSGPSADPGGGGADAGGGHQAGPGDGGPPGSATSGGAKAAVENFVGADPFGELGGGARAGAWALIVGVFAWVLAGARRFTASAIDALPGPMPPVAAHGIVPMDGEWDAFVRTLAGPFRVILVGASNPGVVPGGSLFALGSGRVAVDDVLTLLIHLEPSGPPVVVVVVGGLEGGEGPTDDTALAELGRRLPRSAVVYVFASAASRRASAAAES